MSKVTSISRALTLMDRKAPPAVIPTPSASNDSDLDIQPRRAPMRAIVPTLERETAAAGVAIQLSSPGERRGLKADPLERARYGDAYRPTAANRSFFKMSA